ncbi:uncharacterized protein LOC115389914 isoform X2 [Salarias fasciatus]|uniref:uncharacterized protein LOC115389914 isoform X2 n=1 Tax=Salarias fasciatus TaxID=181472 RepID=UPI00117688FF|nr:uncharacterized protein LOC115389914 isoform X2 [Salarias fasciatus]
MTGVSWLLLSAALLLLAGNSDSVDQNLLGNIVQEIWTDYHAGRMFSMAVSIPRKNSRYDINQVLNRTNGKDVKNTMNSGTVYNQGRIVAAMFQQKTAETGQDIHAEYRVLQNIGNLVNNSNNDFAHDLLIVYVLASPCYHRCTVPDGPDTIIPYLDAVKRWTNYAFVFTHVFKSKDPKLQTTDEELKTAVTNLGKALGLENIFRCKKDNNKKMVCNSCSQNEKVARYCISDEPDDGQNLPSSSRGRDRSPFTTHHRRRQVPFTTQRKRQVPLKTQRKRQVPLKTQRKRQVPLKTQRKKQVPLTTQRKKQVLFTTQQTMRQQK